MGLDLLKKKCEPCEGLTNSLVKEAAQELHEEIPEWDLSSDATMISREFELKNFVEAVELINKVKDVAEEHQHHPDIYLYDYKYLKISLFTHAINGLSQNDFILARHIDEVAR